MVRTSTSRATLASFYGRHLAIVHGGVIEWTDSNSPQQVDIDAMHVTVARDSCYAIERGGRLLGWTTADPVPRPYLEGVKYAAAGETGLLAITAGGKLLQQKAGVAGWSEIAADVYQAWVGDSSDYYITGDGRLYVSGLAHRGQYGDGLLTAVDGWKVVASSVVYVCAHTGHAVLLKENGTVEGTGGNRFGPLGEHGFGDMAERWSSIFEGATRIATGARNTAAVRPDGSLWLWGEHVGLAPVQVLGDTAAVACGERHVLAQTLDGGLWFWAAGARPERMRI